MAFQLRQFEEAAHSDPESGSSSSGSESAGAARSSKACRLAVAASVLAALFATVGLAGLVAAQRLAAQANHVDVGTNADVLQGSISAELIDTYSSESYERRARSPVAGIPESLVPSEHRHDGNRCEDDEEEHAGLCYKKCQLLTNGNFPIRTSSFSCCAGHPCGFTNQKVDMELCRGFDVAGRRAGGGCPHQPGACLQDEELVLDICYKKCSLLTNGAYPHRVTAATCCKAQGIECMNPFNSKTSKAFDVGGGGSSAGTEAAFGAPHTPILALTEASQ